MSKKQDRQGVRTAQDLERKYKLGEYEKLIKELREEVRKVKENGSSKIIYVGNGSSDDITYLTQRVDELESKVTGLTAYDNTLQEQITELRSYITEAKALADENAWIITEIESDVDSLTTSLNELRDGYCNIGCEIATTESEIYSNATWHKEEWLNANGIYRCWCDFVVETLDFTESMYGVNCAYYHIALPDDFFTDKPIFASVTVNTQENGFCSANVVQLEKNVITIAVHRTDGETTTSIENVHFYIEVRGDCSVG